MLHDVHRGAPVFHVHVLLDPAPHRLHRVKGDSKVPDAGSAPEIREVA
jgi:hypothetical protein